MRTCVFVCARARVRACVRACRPACLPACLPVSKQPNLVMFTMLGVGAASVAKFAKRLVGGSSSVLLAVLVPIVGWMVVNQVGSRVRTMISKVGRPACFVHVVVRERGGRQVVHL